MLPDATGKYGAGSSAGSEGTYSLKKQLSILVQNKPFLALLFANGTNRFSLNLQGGVALYFWMYYVGDITLTAKLQVFNLPTVFIIMLVLPMLIKRFSKKEAVCL